MRTVYIVNKIVLPEKRRRALEDELSFENKRIRRMKGANTKEQVEITNIDLEQRKLVIEKQKLIALVDKTSAASNANIVKQINRADDAISYLSDAADQLYLFLS